MRCLVAVVLCTAGACAGPRPAGPPGAEAAAEPVPLRAGEGWRAELALDVAPTGIWCVKPYEVFPQYAEPELVALDDLGRCWVLVSYGGRWTPYSTGADGTWLGISAQDDVDPRIDGPEIYAGAESGRVWQVVAHPEGVIDQRFVAWIPGRPIHALVAGEFDARRGGQELLAFTEPAEIWQLVPRPADQDGFESRRVAGLAGRVRDAVVLDTSEERARAGEPLSDRVLLAMRSGELALLRALPASAEQPAQEAWLQVLDERPLGVGRIAVARGATSLDGVLYFTREDGTIWRLGWEAGRFGAAERIHAGSRGPRGIAAGRFDADPTRETVAIFGYSKEVELLTRTSAGTGDWQARTIFVDADKGHWLSAVELDGRNATDELVCCGYSGRVVVLTRDPAQDR